jgi:hypothetical protein
MIICYFHFALFKTYDVVIIHYELFDFGTLINDADIIIEQEYYYHYFLSLITIIITSCN